MCIHILFDRREIMETENVKIKQPARSALTTTPIRVHKSTAKALQSIVAKINKIPMGKKVTIDQVISKAITLLTDTHIHEIKESTYTSKDLLDLEYKKFCKLNGPISKDEFIRKLLTTTVGGQQ